MARSDLTGDEMIGCGVIGCGIFVIGCFLLAGAIFLIRLAWIVPSWFSR
jgi:hypothetical protein